MSQQNFVEQFRLFMEYARKNSMHSRECMLWVSLFYLANEEATYNAETQTYEWPDDFFEVSNGELNSYGRFDKQAVESLRNRLKQRGLIDFVKGNRNSAAPMYKIHYLIRFGNKIIPNIHANIHANIHSNVYANPIPNNPPNIHANNMPNTMPTIPPLDININNNIPGDTGIDIPFPEEEEETANNPAVSLARERVRRAWVKGFGKEPTPGAVERIVKEGLSCEFDIELIEEIIRRTALRAADDPVAYILKCFEDWLCRGVYTVDQLNAYLRQAR